MYYANTKKDVDDIGFRDDRIYEYLKGNEKETINLHHMNSEEAKKVFEEFKKLEGKEMY